MGRFNYTSFLCLALVLGSTLAGRYDNWGGITLHCRDNENNPVDWWFIYKPPGEKSRFFKSGSNFTYITSDEPGRWVTNGKPITGNTMITHTLEPLYRSTYRSHMAAVAYESRNGTDNVSGTMARGIMMADLMGGLWIGHTVPGFPDMSANWPKFPEAEISNGHMLGCLSLSRDNLDELATIIENAAPDILYYHMPDNKLKILLPNWTFQEKIVTINKKQRNMNLAFSTKDGVTLAVYSRAPGHRRCPYLTFAQNHGLVLDVYGQTDGEHLTSVCAKSFMLRNIEKISLKLPDIVYYVGPSREYSRFAVSTAAHWQRRGTSNEPWACISNLDKEDKTLPGGLLMCIHSYPVWLAFDNLKVAEPKC